MGSKRSCFKQGGSWWLVQGYDWTPYVSHGMHIPSFIQHKLMWTHTHTHKENMRERENIELPENEWWNLVNKPPTASTMGQTINKKMKDFR